MQTDTCFYLEPAKKTVPEFGTIHRLVIHGKYRSLSGKLGGTINRKAGNFLQASYQYFQIF